MKEDTSHLIKRAAHFKSILTVEGFLVGVVAGLIVLAYRVLLEYAGKVMNFVLALGREYPFAVGVWFFILFTLACIVGWLVKKEPFISGSGIPQVEGGFEPAWKRKNRRKIFDYLWSKCRTCRSISCTACRCDVFIRRDT